MSESNLENNGSDLPFDEEKATQEIIEIEEKILKKDPPVKRAEHGKSTGCLRGEFIIDPNIPNDEKIRLGIFQEPGKHFHACVRFSNSRTKNDMEGDAHGMAIKLLGVPGEKILDAEKDAQTQDFLLIDQPVFLIKNTEDYVELFQEVGSENGNILKFFIPSLNPFKWRWRELRISMAIKNKKISSPLGTQYWSSTAYKLGSNAIKFSVKPDRQTRSFEPKIVSKTENYLKEALEAHIQKKEACFDFLIQFQTDPKSMPVEDPTVEWKSPFIKVATLKLPSQTIDSPEQLKFFENISFNPWHSLPEHEPLGGINRPRKQVYQQLSKLRQKLNKVDRREPTVEEFLSIFKDNSDN